MKNRFGLHALLGVIFLLFSSGCSNSAGNLDSTSTAAPSHSVAASFMGQLVALTRAAGLPAPATNPPNPMTGSEDCTNGVDDDGDGAIDQEDTDCYTSGTIYYFSAAGNDSWTGHFPSPTGSDGPKQSLAGAQSVLSGTNIHPGDKLLFRAGDVWTQPGGSHGLAIVAQNSGTAALPVTIGKYGVGAKPNWNLGLTDGAGNILNIRGGNTPTEYLVFEDLHLSNSLTADYNAPLHRGTAILIAEGWYPMQPGHLTFRRMLIDNVARGIISSSGANDLTIEDSVFHNHFLSNTGGQNLTIDCLFLAGVNTTVRNNDFDTCGEMNNWYSHTGYAGGDNFLFENNQVHNSPSGLKLCCGTHGGIVRGNTFYNNQLAGLSIGGGTLNGWVTNIIVENNEFYDNFDALTIKAQHGNAINPGGTDGVIVRNNIFRNRKPGTATGDYGGYVTIAQDVMLNRIAIVNNLFYDVGLENDILINVPLTNSRIKNNIFYKINGASTYAAINYLPASLSGLTLSYNLFYSGLAGWNFIRANGTNYSSLATFTNQTGQGQNSLLTDPLFATPLTYHLTSSSPAVNAGARLRIVPEDHDAVPRPLGGTFDMGPFEDF